MVTVMLAVDASRRIATQNGIPWADTVVERFIEERLDGNAVIGRVSASWLPFDEGVNIVSKEHEDAFNTLDDAFDDIRVGGDTPVVLGGVHVFHQVFRRGLASKLYLFRFDTAFDGDDALDEGFLASWRLAKETTHADHTRQVLMPRDASVSRFEGRE